MTGTVVFPPLAPKRDDVTAVLVPADRASRRPVTSGVRASLWDTQADRELPDRMVRNLSGGLVLLNRDLDTPYTFRIDATAAGYGGPIFVTFQPAAGARRRIVWLPTRPDSPIDPGATVVRGVITRSVAGATASAMEVAAVPRRADGGPPAPGDPTYTGVTDVRGGFALVVHLDLPDPDDVTTPVDTTITLNRGGQPTRTLVRPLVDGREHVFADPLDLDGGNSPPFTGGP